jgi:sulfur transfer protein SufE
MEPISELLVSNYHREIVGEYLALESAQDKLTWLMEREPLHTPVEPHLITEERRVPGCLSGLWLSGHCRSGEWFFSAQSESDMVQGLVSFVCDLYSGRSGEDILNTGEQLAKALSLDRLVTVTRKRAISSTLSYILMAASGNEALINAPADVVR